MSPSAIAEAAAGKGLDAIALTDHNSALNGRAFEQCCRDRGILPVFGIEVTSLEEAHILCLFETYEQAEELGRIIYERLPDIPNNPEKFGDQVYVDAEDNISGEVGKYLISAAEIDLDELLDITLNLKGLFIPAHIDKPVFSIPSQLGFLPDMEYSAVESVALPCPVETGETPVIQNSDAHYIEDIGKRFTIYRSDELSFKGLEKSIKNRNISNPAL